jgi:hypothetical protein
MIRKCLKDHQKVEQPEHSMLYHFFLSPITFISFLLAAQSHVLLTGVTVIRKHSSIRNPSSPNRRSSLDIRFLMESRERRQ